MTEQGSYRTEGAYTPSLDTARTRYALDRTVLAGDAAFDSGLAEFDRMIEAVRAEEREKAAQIAKQYSGPDGYHAQRVAAEIADRIKREGASPRPPTALTPITADRGDLAEIIDEALELGCTAYQIADVLRALGWQEPASPATREAVEESRVSDADVTDEMADAAQIAHYEFIWGEDEPLTRRHLAITRQAWKVAIAAALQGWPVGEENR